MIEWIHVALLDWGRLAARGPAGSPVAAVALAAEQEERAPTEIAREVFERLRAEADAAYREAVDRYRALVEEAEASGGADELPAWSNPLDEHVPIFWEAAQRYAPERQDLRFLLWIVEHPAAPDGPHGAIALDAFRRLIVEYVGSISLEGNGALLAEFTTRFPSEEGAALLARLEQESTRESVRSWARFIRIRPAIEDAPLESDAYLAARGEAQELLDGEDPVDSWLRRTIEDAIGVRENFSLGAVVPDIVGVDLDGVPFKLSDYRGKVLFVDFWGDW